MSGFSRKELIARYESKGGHILEHFIKVCFVCFPYVYVGRESKRKWCEEIAVALTDLVSMRPKKGFRVDREFINDHLGRRIPGLGYIEEIIYLFRRRNPDYENKLENTDDCEGAYKKWLRLMELMDSACGYVTTREVMLVLGVE